MMKIVGRWRDDRKCQHTCRQLPISLDKDRKFVLQLDDPLQSPYRNKDAKYDLQTFIKIYNSLGTDELQRACMMKKNDISLFLSQMVPCDRCRRRAEQMLQQSAAQGLPALDPLVVNACGAVSIKPKILKNPTALYKLFNHDVFHIHSLLKTILRKKKNVKCSVHLEKMQKPGLGRAVMKTKNKDQERSSFLPPLAHIQHGTYWMDIWNDLSSECKNEIVILDLEEIVKILCCYLSKHCVCSDCTTNVEKVFEIFYGAINPEQEGSNCTHNGFLVCGNRIHFEKTKEGHVEKDEEFYKNKEKGEGHEGEIECSCHHDEFDDFFGHGTESPPLSTYETANKVAETRRASILVSVEMTQSLQVLLCSETNHIAHLIKKAEGEISGRHRQCHSKTIDAAWEVLMTCIGVCLYERLQKFWRRAQATKQTWNILFYIIVDTMRRSLEMAVEDKALREKWKDSATVEAYCKELEQEDRKREEKREKRRLKKKRQKERKEQKQQGTL